ncbi:hypothetical protein K8F61_08425 [Microbacterium resistens]|uniref:ATPase BadF/BadG/BcrA/BcrD type domain-containing protein n=1 Tax=Microbacterium resistens TaxID=156977 RepID=A0ABY3RVR5_9MICO|nr:BadF/BadG/BcrA/BcrD ATPase family protein [Microbacterium resistens]UGS28168.1 hypothetical protein K8F61_08425 [Microbacterium resistens]
MTSSATIAIDLGKSRCRARRIGSEETADGPGSPGLAAAGGVDAALAAILPLLSELGVSAARGAADDGVLRIGIGAAGAWASPEGAQALSEAVHARTGAEVATASDVVTAHAGALAGSPGVLLIAGTGAVALGLNARDARLIDGWGPELGDLGSGSWLGREAVRAVLRERDGLGPRTALTPALHAHIAETSDGRELTPIAWLAGPIPVARRLATAAPLVLDLADAGDPAALAIRDEGVRLLVETAVAAADGARAVALHGGLTDHAGYRSSLVAALAARDHVVRDSAGDALDGAALIAARAADLHERYVHRAG